MLKTIKKYWAIVSLTLAYTTIANVVYIMWFDSLWHLWFVDMITCIVITLLGLYIGYVYLTRTMLADKEREKTLKSDELPKENS